MKSTGIVRGIDSLGRIVLPKELRTTLHLDGDTKLEIFVDGDTIVLKKHRPAGSCDFCGDVGRQRHPVCRVLHLPRLPPQDRRAVNQNQKEACVHEPHDRFYCPFHRARAHLACVLL